MTARCRAHPIQDKSALWVEGLETSLERSLRWLGRRSSKFAYGHLGALWGVSPNFF